jgi:hypothetical protein
MRERNGSRGTTKTTKAELGSTPSSRLTRLIHNTFVAFAVFAVQFQASLAAVTPHPVLRTTFSLKEKENLL